MTGLTVRTTGWRGTFNGIASSTPAWECLNVVEFRGLSIRRSNIALGGRDGTFGTRSALDELRVVTEWFVVGECDPSGVTALDPEDQFEQNLNAIRDGIIHAPQDDRGCFGATLIDPSGVEYGVSMQAHGWIPPLSATAGIAMITLVVPAGRLELA